MHVKNSDETKTLSPLSSMVSKISLCYIRSATVKTYLLLPIQQQKLLISN